MDFRHYSDNAAALAAELANVFEQDHASHEEAAAALTALFDEHEVRDTVHDADVPGMLDLGDRLRAVFDAADLHAATEAVNRLLAASAAAPWISEHDDLAPHLHFAPINAGLVERITANTAMGLAVVLCDYGFERLGVCADANCADVFVDTSRNAQRRYCSQGCGNRSNVRAHRARQREEA